MNIDFIKPFIDATANVLLTMCQVEIVQGAPYTKPNSLTYGAVTGVIGMGGPSTHGNLAVSFDEPAILDIVSKMLMEQFKEISPDVVDAVGELTNMICGGAKRTLGENGLQFEMATPLMITGKDVAVLQLSKEPTTVIPFSTSAGKFVVEFNVARDKES